MSQGLRTALMFAALFLLVIVGSVFYARLSRVDPVPTPRAVADGVEPTPTSPAVEAAVEAFREGRLDEARSALLAITPADPGHFAALENLAAVELQLGNLEESLRAMTHLARLRPDDPRTLLGLSAAHYRLGDYAAAELAALRSFEAGPARAATRFKLGLYRLAQNRVAAAISTYHRAFELPDAREQMYDAVDNLDELEAREPELAGVHYAHAYFAHRMGRRELEIDSLERYLSANPVGPTAVNAREQLASARAASPSGS